MDAHWPLEPKVTIEIIIKLVLLAQKTLNSIYTYTGEVKLWDTPSAQCIRTLPHKGTVVTVQFMPTPPSLIDR